MADADVRWLQRLENYERALASLERALSLAATRPLSELEQHNSGNHGPTPTADQSHEQHDQREAKGQQGQGEKLAEQVQHFRNRT